MVMRAGEVNRVPALNNIIDIDENNSSEEEYSTDEEFEIRKGPKGKPKK